MGCLPTDLPAIRHCELAGWVTVNVPSTSLHTPCATKKHPAQSTQSCYARASNCFLPWRVRPQSSNGSEELSRTIVADYRPTLIAIAIGSAITAANRSNRTAERCRLQVTAKHGRVLAWRL